MALQHFCRSALLDMDFMSFHKPLVFHRDNATAPRHVFYGISQGGVLGGAYAALAGARGLLDGTILGNPGTPFSLLMPRSDIFPFYEALMLMNLHYKRHVRIVLSLMQIFWDSVEVTGVLSRPLTEPVPKTLIFTGLGDSTVSTLGAEVLARAYGAVVVEGGGNRHPHGLAVAQEVDALNTDEIGISLLQERAPLSSTTFTSAAVFTEILYEKEWQSTNAFSDRTAQRRENVPHNDVHWCTRLDPALQHQIDVFIVEGLFVDPCKEDANGCVRSNATC